MAVVWGVGGSPEGNEASGCHEGSRELVVVVRGASGCRECTEGLLAAPLRVSLSAV